MRVGFRKMLAGSALMSIVGLVLAVPGLSAGIASFSPAFAILQSPPCNGGVITITGSGFVSDGPVSQVSVSFNGTPAAWISVGSDTTIYAIAAAGTTAGPITVSTAHGSATSAASFYPYQCWWSETDTTPVTIFSFSPSKVKPGAKVTIQGSSFTGATAVKIGGLKASFTVSSSRSIVATVPAAAKAGSAVVTVTAPAGTASSLTPLKIT